jgi:hypothetical protein
MTLSALRIDLKSLLVAQDSLVILVHHVKSVTKVVKSRCVVRVKL